MGGWYSDAFKSNMSSINTKNITSDKGSAAKELGDAFSKIGTAMREDELFTKKNALYDSQLESEKLNLEEKQQQIDSNQAKSDQKNIDDAFLSNLDKNGKFKDNDVGVDLNLVSYDTKVKQDNFAQTKFNDSAIKLSTTFDSWDKFKTSNPTLIENADGVTVQKIKNSFDTTNSKIKNLKTQTIISGLNTKINKEEIKNLQKDNKDKGFKYTENTGTKITALVKSSLGLDNELTVLDDKKQKEFENMVTSISTISKEYKLEPNMAFKKYLKIEKTNKEILSIAETALDKSNLSLDEKQKEFDNMVTSISAISSEHNLDAKKSYELYLKNQPTKKEETPKKFTWKDISLK